MYVLQGHEAEGFYDILTGRPRYPVELYNQIVKARRVATRHNVGRRPGKITSPFSHPRGLAHAIPNLDAIIALTLP